MSSSHSSAERSPCSIPGTDISKILEQPRNPLCLPPRSFSASGRAVLSRRSFLAKAEALAKADAPSASFRGQSRSSPLTTAQTASHFPPRPPAFHHAFQASRPSLYPTRLDKCCPTEIKKCPPNGKRRWKPPHSPHRPHSSYLPQSPPRAFESFKSLKSFPSAARVSLNLDPTHQFAAIPCLLLMVQAVSHGWVWDGFGIDGSISGDDARAHYGCMFPHRVLIRRSPLHAPRIRPSEMQRSHRLPASAEQKKQARVVQEPFDGSCSIVILLPRPRP